MGPGPVRQQLGEYELGEELGRGAMGAVYRARHVTLGQEVALKVILAGEFASEVERRRFLSEAGKAARLDHPGIIRVLNYGEVNGRQYYAMELVEGPTLARLASADFAEPPLPEGCRLRDDRMLAALMAGVARAVQHAHDRGVLHRDLKPGNILLDADGRPHVGDFGLAKLIGDDAAVEGGMTLTGSPVGTPAYMAPEQVRGERVLTVAADVWSLGAILMELLSGRPPFAGPNAAETYRRILEEDPVGPPAAGSVRRRDLELIARKCLRKEPAQRYASASALADDLDRWLRDEPIEARPVSGGERLWLWARRRPVVASLSTALGLLILLVAVVGPLTAIRLAQAGRKEKEARADAQEKLYESLLAQARASRLTLEPSRRETGLAAVRAAAGLRVTPELRDEAAALLALPGLGHATRFTNFIFRGRGVTLTPDFQRFLRVEADFDITLRDRLDGHVLFRWEAPATNVVASQLVLSPEQTRLAANFPGPWARVVTLPAGQPVLDARGSRFGTFSPDGRWFVTVQDERVVRLHDSLTGQARMERRFDRPVRVPPVFHPGNYPVMAVPVGNELLLWHWERGTVLERFTEEAVVCGTSWHGDLLASSMEDGRVRLLNLRTRQQWLLSGHRSTVDELHFSPDGRMLASVYGYDGLAHAWDTLTGTPLFRSDRFRFRQFRADGSGLLLEDTVSWGVVAMQTSTVHQADAVLADQPKSFSPDGRWLLAGGREGLEIREMDSGRRLLSQAMADCIAVQLLPGGRELLACDRKRLVRRALRVDEGRLRLGPEQVIYTARGRLEAAAFTPDGKLGAVTWGDSVEVLDLGAGGAVRMAGQGSVPRSPTFSADGRWLVTGTFHGRGLQVWEIGTNLFRGPLFNTGNVSARFSPDGRRLLAATSEGLLVFASGSWELLYTLPSELASGLPGEAAWSANGRLLAYVQRGTSVVLIDTEDWKAVLRLTSPTPMRVTGLAWDPSGEWLLVSGDRRVERWNLTRLEKELVGLGVSWDLPPAGIPTGEVLGEYADVAPLGVESALTRGLRPRQEYPRRPVDATADHLDLTPHFNARLDEDWHRTGNPGNSLATLPAGVVELDDVRFDVRGLVQLASRDLRAEATGYPLAVTNIMMGRSCRKLHFLGACGYAGGVGPGGVAGHYRLHLADDTVTDVPIRIGQDSADWWAASDTHPPGNRVRAAWSGRTPEGQSVRLFRQAWHNPRPEVAIRSIDFVSARDAAAPFLVAITAE